MNEAKLISPAQIIKMQHLIDTIVRVNTMREPLPEEIRHSERLARDLQQLIKNL